ncbi:uncharacterized membrane protein DDB_G0293934-like [Nilaparvata lugens]|uniref:uncharacterized membrane protein DDB_G0293934-like n=1 Tax=Nilaparvata lugens TaxID=108931 RepID=UPI00193D946B|nr:uncharacterized membrane protein DDB_G0293934-like [Nilaparvata lugens]
MHGSVENTTNSAMNVHVDKISESTSPTQTGGHVMHIIVNKNKNTHGPLSSHIQHTSKPNTYKNKTSPLITETNTEYGNNSKPHSTTSYEKPKPILVTASNRPNTSHNHASETHSNVDRPEQKPDNFTPEHEPNNNNHFPNEHHGNHYGVIEPVFETQFPSSGAVSGIEENSDLHQQLIFMPNNGESSDEFVENSYELISSHEGNHHEPHSSLELGGATGDYQINNPHHHNNGPYFHENYNLDLQSGEESSDKSGEDNYGSYHQSNNHQCHTPGNHDYHHHSKPNSQQSHSQKPSYNSYPHRTHYHGHHNNERPNRFSSSHKLEFNDYHKELYRPYQDEQNSHSNHHNYYEKPVSNYHTHQVSKPFSIDHGSPYGVSGIFINNFKKRPNFWYNHRSSEYENSIETFRDDDYRERRRNSGGDSSLRKSVDIKDEEDYRSRSHTSKNSGYESVYKKSSKYDVGNPHSSSRRYQYSDIDSSDEEYSYSIPETFLGNFRDGRPPTIEYDLKEGYNNHLIQEAEKALAYVMNPYAYRPNIVQHNGLQHTSHQGLLIDPNHHQQHNIYNYIQPHHGHHSNRHEYATSTPKYHHSVGLETTHTPGHNPSIHSAGHHNTLAHEHPEALHSHQSNNIPVKYVYIPVLNNFQPYMQEYATKMAIPSSLSSNTLSSNLKLNRSNADYSKRLASSQSSSAVNSQEQVVKPSMKIFEAPIRISSSLPVETPQVVHESSPLLLHLLNSPKLTYLEAFPGNVDLNARDSKEHLRRVELLEEEEEVKVEAEDDDKPITSNWHQTQELHEKYSSKCKDVWDSILFAQKYGIEKQGRPFSRSKDEVSTAVQELEKKVESLISRRKRSNTLEPESGQDSLESNCIEVLKNALLSQLEILDIKRREEKNKDNKDGTQTMDKLEGDDLRLAESITVPESVPVNELKKDDLPITFESEQQVEMNDRVEAEQQESLDSSQDYHW